MHKRNWSKYNKTLVQRGSITFLIESNFFSSIKKTHRKKKRGRPQEFHSSLIYILLSCKILYRLSYRALEGFSKSIFPKFGCDINLPTYSLICKKAASVVLPKFPKSSSHIILIDASGMKVCGEGEWKRKIHGKSKRRKWVKLHIAIDANSQDIVAAEVSESNVHDMQKLESLIDQIEGEIEEVLADGAYDGGRKIIEERGAKGLIPPPRNARYRDGQSFRDQTIKEIKGLGGDELARSIWGKLHGYNMRVLVETAFSRLKRLFGDRLFSKRFDNQLIENMIRCELINRMNRISA